MEVRVSGKEGLGPEVDTEPGLEEEVTGHHLVGWCISLKVVIAPWHKVSFSFREWNGRGHVPNWCVKCSYFPKQHHCLPRSSPASKNHTGTTMAGRLQCVIHVNSLITVSELFFVTKCHRWPFCTICKQENMRLWCQRLDWYVAPTGTSGMPSPGFSGCRPCLLSFCDWFHRPEVVNAILRCHFLMAEDAF